MQNTMLRILAEEARTGEALREALGLDEVEFRAAVRQLWLEGLIQGQLADGCCSAPCGTMCVSAMKPQRIWQLSKKGRLRLKVLAAKGESI